VSVKLFGNSIREEISFMCVCVCVCVRLVFIGTKVNWENFLLF